jgi:hypothetical protein
MSHFTRVKHSKMLARIQAAQLEGDEIGVAMIAFFLMCEREGPISDDMQWLGRKSGVSTRRANQIRAKLIDAGIWQARDGMIGDHFALDEVIYRASRTETYRSNAMARWEKGEAPRQPQLDLGNGVSEGQKAQISANPADAIASPGDKSGGEREADAKAGEKTAENDAKTPEKEAEKDALKSEETAENRQSDPDICITDSHARATSKNPESRESTAVSESESTPAFVRSDDPPSLDEQTLDAQLGAILLAAGFNPQTDRAKQDARRQVEKWTGEGISVERSILPAVRDQMQATNDPTSSLYRFDRQVRLIHARIAAKPAKPNGAGKPAPTATFEFPGEAESFIAFRRDLCDAIGPDRYVGLAHDVRFEQMDDRPIVRVNSAPGAYGMADHRLKDNCLSALKHVAAKHGFNQVW